MWDNDRFEPTPLISIRGLSEGTGWGGYHSSFIIVSAKWEESYRALTGTVQPKAFTLPNLCWWLVVDMINQRPRYCRMRRNVHAACEILCFTTAFLASPLAASVHCCLKQDTRLNQLGLAQQPPCSHKHGKYISASPYQTGCSVRVNIHQTAPSLWPPQN